MNAVSARTSAVSIALASSIVAGVLVFILTYNPTIAVIDASLLRGVWLVGIAAGVVAGTWFAWPRQLVLESLLLVGGFVVAFGGAQALAFRGGGDTYFLSLMVACLTGYIPAAFVVARFCVIGQAAVPKLISLVALVAAAQAVLITLDWVSPAAHVLFSTIVVQPDLSQIPIRAAGLSSSAGDGLAFLQSLGAMSATFLAATAHQRSRQFGWASIAAICLMSIILAGRTGFVLFAVFALVIGLRASLTAGVLRTTGVVVAAFLAIGGVAALVLPYETVSMLFNKVLPHAFEFIDRYLAGAGFGTASTDDLRTMLFLPTVEQTLLIGSGYFADPLLPRLNYMGSDIGYVRTIFYVGIVGSVLVYGWYATFWLMLRRLATSPDLMRFVDALFVVFFVAHAKFPFLFLGAGLAFSFALFFGFHFDRRRCTSAA